MRDKKLILIVDDIHANIELLEALLNDENYNIKSATSGPEALQKIDEDLPDLILLDVLMPEMNGFEVCRIIKNNKKLAHIPIILVTALDEESDTVEGFEAGADDFISKPVRTLELKARVRSLIRVKEFYDRLQRTAQMRESLSNMIAHDIRNPLTVVMGMASLLQMTLSDETLKSYADDIYSSANRVNGFLDDLLVLAKSRSKGLVLNKSNSLIVKILENQFKQANFSKSKDIELLFSCSIPENTYIDVDENLILRVLDNLLSNSIKYTPQKGQIVCSIEESETGFLNISIKDSGDGIPEGMRESIFNMYENDEVSDKGNVMSFGIGLSFCKLVIEAHGGQIWASENDPHGTIITFTLKLE